MAAAFAFAADTITISILKSLLSQIHLTDGRVSEHCTVVQNRKGIGQREFPFPLFSPPCICPKSRRPHRQALSYRFISRFLVARRNNIQCKQCYVKLQYAMQEVNLGPKFPSAMPALNLAVTCSGGRDLNPLLYPPLLRRP